MRLVALSAVCAAMCGASATADVLWDQSSFDPFGAGFFNSVSGSPPFGLTVFAVNDVVVDGDGWTVTDVTTYYSFLDPGWGFGIFEGHVHVFPKTGPLPDDVTDDPTASPIVTMTASEGGDHWIVKASGLDIELAPGEYWIGITPIAPSGPFGPEFHISCLDTVGHDTPTLDVGFPDPSWTNPMPGLDAAILVEGTEITGCCNGDLDGSGDIGFPDLLAVLTAWGACPGCPEDLDGDDIVGFTDLLVVLNGWGPCS